MVLTWFAPMQAPADASPPTTNWSLIVAAQSSPEHRQAALARLCQLYWPPLYVFARRHGLAAADAEDATQGFFAKILAQDWLAQLDPQKGRFRGFLYQSMAFHLSELRRRQQAEKRGGGAQHVPLDADSAEQRYLTTASPAGSDPAASFDFAWACTVLEHALARLAAEEAAAGRGVRWAALQPFLTKRPTPGDYDRLSRELGIARPTVAVWVHRLGRRHRELIRAVVADTLVDPTELDGELRHLLQSFAGDSGPA